MALTPGTRLGVYEVTAQIGQGGMGQVYRATDTNLKRQVAIKVLPSSVAGDTERLARFQREAEVLAALNHPNIAAIYGLDKSDGTIALVMELVEGPTLADRITQGAFPIDEALSIAKQIAEALEAAHEQGIIHRDLKPANIKVRPDSTVKVLDFGLAKAMEPAAGSSPSMSMSPTITTPAMTQAGMILGTAAYMSPEQAKGRTVDKRSDIWAFGCVLYEMLAGRRAFAGDDVSTTLARVIEREPDWTALPASTPASVRRLVRRCLEKDRKRRIADASDVRLELSDAEAEPPSDTAASPAIVPCKPSRIARPVVPLMAAVGAALVTGMVVWRVHQPADVPRALMRFAIDLPDGVEITAASRNPVAISPDGTHFVYVANQRLYLRGMDQLDAVPIAGTQSSSNGFARGPLFSADGQWIAYWQQGQLRKVALSGGPPVTICQTTSPPFGATWGPDGHILWGDGNGGIMWVPAGGGTAAPLVSVKTGERASMPQMLPSGEWVLFVLHPPGAAMDQGKAVVQSRTTGERRALVDGLRDVRYVPSGHLVYGRGNTLLAQAFDPARLTVSGDAVSVLDGVANSSNVSPEMFFTASATGALLYIPGTTATTTSTRLVQVARDGTRKVLADIAGMSWFPRFSPEGARVAFGVSVGPVLNDPSDLWVLDVARGARTRVTFTANNRFYPIWTRDGSRLTFADGTESTNRLLSALADGSGGVQTLLDTGTRRYPTSWSHDGHTLAFYAGGQSSAGGGTPSRDIWMLHVDGDKRTTTPFVETPFEERGAIFSPDDHWLAYVSNKSGQNDIYARPYPGPGSEVTISVDGGQEPVWAPSGRELFYRHDGKLLAVPIEERGASLIVGAPTRVFDDPYRLDTGGAQGGVANYDVSPDGQHFVMVEEPKAPAAAAQRARLQMTINWLDDLRARVPTK